MVGIAGRSKGCQTCKRRRVKCDERMPTCLRCEKGGFECLGYSKILKIVSENSRAQRHAQIQAAARLRVAEGDRKARSDSPRTSSVESGSASASGSGSDSVSPGWSMAVIKYEAVEPIAVSPSVCKEMDLSAFNENIRISFTISNILAGAPSTKEWLQLGYNKEGYSINSHALRALSCTYFGRMHHLPESEAEGVLHYGRALRALSHAVGSDQATSLPVLTGSMIASCYEMIASYDQDGSLSHAGGIGRLFEIRGPKLHRKPFELLLLMSMRTTICAKALVERKRTFLERAEWKTSGIPWSLYPEMRIMSDYITDILCDIPGIAEDCDKLAAGKVPREQLVTVFTKIQSDIHKRFKLIYKWRTTFEQIYPDFCTEMPTAWAHSPFPTVLRYKDLQIANGLMIYNAILLILIILSTDLMGPNYDHSLVAREIPFTVTNPALQAPGASGHAAAVEVLRSAEYHITPPHANAGAFFVVMPLKVAWDFFPKESVVHNWVKKEVMTLIASQSGFHFAKGVLNNYEHGRHYK